MVPKLGNGLSLGHCS
uniref:Uncharacterized protein n=1 Tax=Arundo donax TaxID=35708 RepID=A0A0A9B9H4_ARUDO